MVAVNVHSFTIGAIQNPCNGGCGGLFLGADVLIAAALLPACGFVAAGVAASAEVVSKRAPNVPAAQKVWKRSCIDLAGRG